MVGGETFRLAEADRTIKEGETARSGKVDWLFVFSCAALHNPGKPYILVCDRPKIDALKRQFPDLFVDYKERQ